MFAFTAVVTCIRLWLWHIIIMYQVDILILMWSWIGDAYIMLMSYVYTLWLLTWIRDNYIPEIWNFGDVMVLVWTPPPPHPPPPPHAKACVSRNCDTNARIKFIFDTAIHTLEWKNPIDFGENRKTKMAAKRPFCENMMKKLVHSITSSKMHRSTSYLI